MPDSGIRSIVSDREGDIMMNMEWTDGFRIFVSAGRDREVTVSANREGLLSLARQLRRLADGLTGDHIHYDEYNALEEGSAALIIEKTE